MAQNPTDKALEKKVEELEQKEDKRSETDKGLETKPGMRDVLLDNLPGIALILKKGTREIVASNLSAKHADAVPGKKCFETVARRNAPCPFCLAPQLWSTDNPQQKEVENRGKYFKGIWVPLNEELYVHYIFDISAQKRAEAMLRESEKKLRLSLAGSGVSFWEWFPENGDIYFDEHWAKIMGFGSGEMTLDFKWWERNVHPTSKPVFEKSLKDYLEGKKPRYELEYQIRTKTGEWKWIWAAGECVEYNHKGAPYRFLGTHRDITEQKQLQNKVHKQEVALRQAQRVESIGTLAGGVAHEINNPINSIMNYAQLIKDKTAKESSLTGYASEIIHETERVAVIVRNLLMFARQDKESHTPSRIVDIVTSTLSLIQTIVRTDQITINVNVPDDLPKLTCRSQQLQQVLMNLITNARDALNDKYSGYNENKIIVINSKLFEKESRTWIRTTVEDRGVGIDPALTDRIFDPFFTTKGRLSGTGLGLSISYGIVKDHHGELTFESEFGRYTKFHMDLPLADDRNIEKKINDHDS